MFRRNLSPPSLESKDFIRKKIRTSVKIIVMLKKMTMTQANEATVII